MTLERMNEELEDANRRLEREVVERRRAEAELRDREQQLAEAQAIAHVGSWQWDVVGERMEWSEELQRIFGVDPARDSIDYEFFLSRVHPDDRDGVQTRIEEALESAETYEHEYRIVLPEGTVRHVHGRGRVVRDGDGGVLRLQGTVQDLTHLRAAREALRETEERFRRIVETAHEGIWTIDAEGVTTYVNGRMAELLGLEPEEMVGRHLFDFMDDDARRQAEQNLERRRRGIREDHEFRLRHRDGHDVWTHMSTSPLQDEHGNYAGALAMVTDIGERVRAEEEIRTRRAQLEEAQATAHVGSWEWDIEADQVEWSDELYRIFGLEPGSVEVDYDTFLSRLHPEDRERTDRFVRAAFETGEAFQFEHRVVRPDGEVRTLLGRGRVVHDEDGRVVRMTGTGQDITERVRAEEALRRSEENYRMLADYSSDMILRFTPEGTCTYASPAARTLLGIHPEALVGEMPVDLIHPDDVEIVAESHRRLLKVPGPDTVMCRLRRKDGGWTWVESTAQGVRDPESGWVESIVSVARDVTESVRAASTIRLLQRVAIAANEASSIREAMQAALRLVCDHMEWPVGHVYLPARTVRGELAPTDIWHLEDPDQFERFRDVTRSARFHAGEGLPGRVLETGRPAWIEDVREDPGFVRRHLVEQVGVRTAFAFPVRAGDETLAVLEFFTTETGPPEPDILEALDNVGAQLGQVGLRQRTEAALRASEQRFRALAETASDAIVTADEENRIVYCNEGVARIFGHRVEALVGRPLTDLMPERFRETHREGFRQFLETREPKLIGRPIELVGLRRDGTEIPVELSIGWWESDEGVFFTGIVRDITERKKAEEELNDKMEELARSNAELGLFTYVASHDLREPLRTVGSNVQLVARRLGPGLDDGTRKSIDFALSGVRRMQELIDDLLTYSRVGTEGKPFERVDMDAVLSEAEESLRVAIVDVDGEITRDALPKVTGDASQLAQLFQNLLSNALKFRREGESPRVHVSARRAEREWVLSVEDNGIGIDPAYADHVFTIFQRLHSQDEYPGTGIGLAVCRKIIERHGGRIWVESEPGEGSVFKFTLPAR